MPGGFGVTRRSGVYCVNGVGNRFVLVDCMGVSDVEACLRLGPIWARTLVHAPDVWADSRGQAPDGLVLLLPAQSGGQARMVLFNLDGSRPEACGNALRCLTRVACDMGLIPGPQFVVETDAGERRVDALRFEAKESRVGMGAPRLIDGALKLHVGDRSVQGTSISVGNPHFVLRANSIADSEVARLGAQLCTHSQFPNGTNVEFVFGEPDRPRVRVWERGVGETEACGSGACATATALWGTALLRRELTLDLPGGPLVVGRNTHGLWLQGGAEWEILPAMEVQSAQSGIVR